MPPMPKKNRSRVKIAVVAILVLLALGLMIDAFSGFYILKNARSLGWGIGGLLIVALFYLIGEAGSGWIDSKDDVSHPLHKRAFHLSLLITFVGAIMVIVGYVLNKMGW